MKIMAVKIVPRPPPPPRVQLYQYKPARPNSPSTHFHRKKRERNSFSIDWLLFHIIASI